MTKVCICQICTCGRHRCPHHPKAAVAHSGQQCLVTEYAQRFTPKQGEVTRSCKPANEGYKASGPMEKDTTNKMDYIKHPLEKRHVRVQETYRKPEGAMEGMTSYAKEYEPKAFAPVKAFKPDYSRKVSGKFAGASAYVEDYRRWTPQPTERYQKDNTYRSPSAPFVGLSENKEKYVAKYQPTRPSMKPAEAAIKSNKPFDDGTSYNIDYPKKAIPEREIKQKQVYKVNKEPLDGLSSYMKEFVPKEATKLPSCKPEASTMQSNAKFHEDTTQKVDYPRWPLDKPFVRAKDTYVKPDGKMEGSTTTHRDYDKKPLAPHPPAKPMERKAVPGKFFSDTTTKLDYQKWAPIQNNRVVKASDYRPPSVPFEGQTNYTSDFTKHQGKVRASMKPMEAAKLSDAPFDDRTGYKADYTRKALPERQVKEKAQWMTNQVPFEGKTNYTDDFIPKRAEMAKNFKPEHVPQQADVPFADHTTTRVDYKAWQVEKPYVHPKEVYQPPQGEFCSETVHKSVYTPKPIGPVQAIRPMMQKREPGRFEDSTTYGGDYIKKAVSAQRVEKKSDYRPPSVPFQAQSHYVDDFIRHPNSMRQSLKPAENAVGSNAKFEGQTMYTADYYKKQVPLCPAINLDTTTSKYVFQEQQPTGHKYYQKMGTPPVQLPVA